MLKIETDNVIPEVIGNWNNRLTAMIIPRQYDFVLLISLGEMNYYHQAKFFVILQPAEAKEFINHLAVQCKNVNKSSQTGEKGVKITNTSIGNMQFMVNALYDDTPSDFQLSLQNLVVDFLEQQKDKILPIANLTAKEHVKIRTSLGSIK